MAREWREIGKLYRPREEFDSAWALYHHATRLIIDRTFAVTADLADVEPRGIMSHYMADLLGKADEGAVEAAKHHMASTLGAAAFLDDLKTFGGDRALRALLEETQVEQW